MFEKLLDKILFLDIRKSALLSEKQNGDATISIPIYYENFNEGINNNTYSEGIPLNDIVYSMAVLLGIDNSFKYRDTYIKILKDIDVNIEKVLFKMAVDAAKEEKFEISYVIFNFIYDFFKCDKVIKFNKGFALYNLVDINNLSSENEIYKKAIELFEEVRAEDKTLRTDYLAILYLKDKNYAKASENFENFLTHYKGDKNSLEVKSALKNYNNICNIVEFEKGLEDFDAHNYELAIEKFLSLSYENENWFALMFLIGKCYRNLNNIDEALNYFIKAEEMENNNSDLNNEIGLCYYIKEDLKTAKQFFKKAISIEDENPAFLMNLAALYIQLDEIEKSEEIVKKVLEISPNDDIAKECEEIINKIKNGGNK